MGEAPRTAAEVRADVLDQLAEYTSIPDVRQEQRDVLLREYGVDSFGTFELILKLEERLGLAIPDSLFDARRCRSVDGIVELLMEAYGTSADL